MLFGWNGVSRRASLPSRLARAVATAAACCVLGNLVFIHSFVKDGELSTNAWDDGGAYFTVLNSYFELVNGSEYRLLRENDSYLNCSAISSLISWKHYVASGWTKSTYEGTYNGTEPVAVKIVNGDGHDIAQCLKEDPTKVPLNCYRESSAKILNEIVHQSWLDHPNVAKMLGYCVPAKAVTDDVTKGVTIVTELGDPVDVIRLLQMSWEDRLRVSLGLARLLYHTSRAVRGPAIISDFRRQQFVLRHGEIKLSDMDDLSFGDPECAKALDCRIDGEIQVPCMSGRCTGFAEKSNIHKTGRHFVRFLLEPGAPPSLRHRLRRIVEAYCKASWDADSILRETETVFELYSNGSYRSMTGNVHLKDYVREEQSDLPGRYDYRCRTTFTGGGCSISVFDEGEAAEQCSSDAECRAFVITDQRTWSGRRIAYFKNGYGQADPSNSSTVYRRRA